MALTLTEGNLYSTTDMLSKTVIDRLVKDSDILQKLPFETLLGNSDTYVTVTTDSGAAFYAVGDTWTESTPSLTSATVTLKVMGGDADIDNFLLATRANKLDLKGTILNNKTKAVQYKFLDTFFYGNATSYPNEFNGLQVLISNSTYNTVSVGSSGTPAVLSIAKLQQAIDLIPNSWEKQVNGIWITKTLRRGIQTYLDTVGDKFVMVPDRNGYGKMIEYFRGMEIHTDDHILNTETISSGVFSASTGGASTSIFILTFDSEAVCGVQGGEGLKTVPLGDLETKDASRFRIKWYCGLKFKDLRSSVKVDGVTAAGTVTA